MAKKRSSFKQLVNGEEPVLIDFYATWCGPCKAMLPIIKDLAKLKDRGFKIVKIDIDKNQKLSHKLKIKAVPTLQFYNKGKLLWTKSGMVSKHKILKLIRSHS